MSDDTPNVTLFDVCCALGACYTKTAQHEQAIANYRQAAQQDPASDRPHVGLGVVYIQQGHRSRADDAFRRALECNPHCSDASCGQAMVAEMGADTDAALAHYIAAHDRDPANLTALMGVVRHAYGTDRLDCAVRHLDRYLALYPANVRILYCKAGTLFKMERLHDALHVLERLLIFDPEHAEARALQQSIMSGGDVCCNG